MISTATRKVAISIERMRAGSPTWGRSSNAAAIADWLAGAGDTLAAHARTRLAAWSAYRDGLALNYAA